jgi:peptidoglycan/LPS O-acetylase OafA/YrhL
VGGLYHYNAHPVTGMLDSGALTSVLFLPVVVALSVGTGSLPAVLSTRLMHYGGRISFSLYMIHEPVHTVWDWTVRRYDIVLSMAQAKMAAAALIVVAIGAAMLLYHLVEEPAQRRMRRMVHARDTRPAAPRAKLQAVSGPQVMRPVPASTRAG